MENENLKLCENIVSNLIVPAFCTLGHTIVAVNPMAKARFPAAIVGGSAYELFPEAIPINGYAEKDFDVMSFEGLVGVNITPLMEYELWQFTLRDKPVPVDENVRLLTTAQVSIVMAQVNQLIRRCPEQKEICTTMYHNCCKLLKSAALYSDSMFPPTLTATNLERFVANFSLELSAALVALDVRLVLNDLKPAYISAELRTLQNIFCEALSLCCHTAGRGCEISVSTSAKNNKNYLTFEITGMGTADQLDSSERDYALTKELINKHCRRLSGQMYTVSDGDKRSFVFTFPEVENFNLLCDSAPQPIVGIPPHLVFLSGVLPPEYYETQI